MGMRGCTLLIVVVFCSMAWGQGRGQAAQPKLGGKERHDRTRITWGARLPTPPEDGQPRLKDAQGNRPRPLLVCVRADYDTQDQQRFDLAVEAVDNFQLATRFFDCVEINESAAKKAPLLEGLNFKAPSLIIFNAELTKRKVARGRAGVMKGYSLMRQLGQPTYKTLIRKTLTEAKKLLGQFDQVDAARDALAIKMRRYETALSKGKNAKAATLKKSIDKDQEEIDELYAESQAAWTELWKLRFADPK